MLLKFIERYSEKMEKKTVITLYSGLAILGVLLLSGCGKKESP